MGGAAQEAVAIGQHFERARAANDLAALDLPPHDADDQLGASHAVMFGDAFASSASGKELGHGQAIKIVEAHAGGLDAAMWAAWTWIRGPGTRRPGSLRVKQGRRGDIAPSSFVATCDGHRVSSGKLREA